RRRAATGSSPAGTRRPASPATGPRRSRPRRPRPPPTGRATASATGPRAAAGQLGWRPRGLVSPGMWLAADTGGTFTDVVTADGRIAKVLSTPVDPSVAVAAGMATLAGRERPDLLAHGTTVATNALLERRGASRSEEHTSELQSL